MLNISNVFAAPLRWTTHLFVVDVSGESNAYSGKYVGNIGDGVTWSANIVTYVDNPPISLMIGWNYFSGTEKCGSVDRQNEQGDPRYISAQQTADTIYLIKMPCAGTRYGISNGKHIVSSGGTNYYDEWSHPESIP